MKRFTATVQPNPDNASLYVEVPFDPKEAFGKVRAPVKVTIRGFSFATTIARMKGRTFIGLNRANREGTGVAAGESVRVAVELDTTKREVTPPKDLVAALRTRKGAKAAWERLSYTHQREHVEAIEEAKRPETRQRRIAKCLQMLAGVGIVAAVALGAPREAAAAPQGDTFGDARGYVYVSPAFFAAPLGDDDVTDAVDLSYQWGLGGGGFWTLGASNRLGIAAGLAFEHNPATLDNTIEDACDIVNAHCAIHVFRILPEVRVGAAIDRFYGYGLLAPGLGLIYGKYDGFLVDNEDTDAGFNLGLGFGAQYLVWRRLSLGGELGFDLGFYVNDETDFGNDDSYGAYTLDLKLLVGWYF